MKYILGWLYTLYLYKYMYILILELFASTQANYPGQDSQPFSKCPLLMLPCFLFNNPPDDKHHFLRLTAHIFSGNCVLTWGNHVPSIPRLPLLQSSERIYTTIQKKEKKKEISLPKACLQRKTALSGQTTGKIPFWQLLGNRVRGINPSLRR